MMATTALIAEILVLGMFGMIWIILLFAQIIDLQRFYCFASNLKDWVPLFSVLFILLFYQVGWIINFLSYGLTKIFFERKIREGIFNKEKLSYHNVRPYVYQNASDHIKNDLSIDRSVCRMARAGILNFGLISIIVFIDKNMNNYFGGVSTLIALICLLQWYFRFNRYYNRMIDIYHTIKK